MRLTVAGLQTRGLSDAHAGPALAAQHFHAGSQFGGGRAGGAMRTRGAVLQSGRAAFTEAADPLGGRGLSAELELLYGCSRVQTHFSCQNFLGQLFSTVNREAGMMMVVHSVSWVTVVRKLSFPVLDRMDNNVLKLHI